MISVIVPARNAAATLAQALTSLLIQTDGDWQAIIVDDGSTDDTAAIARSFAARDTRFKLVTGPGRGVSAARNAGIAEALSSWLLFLDADDWIAPDYVEMMLGRLASDPDAAAVYCGYRRVMPSGAFGRTRFDGTIAERPAAVFASRVGVAIHAVLVRHDLVQQVGGFDETLQICEDFDLWQRVSALGGAWLAVPQPLAFYQTSANSLSRDPAEIVDRTREVARRGQRAAGISPIEVAFIDACLVIWAAAFAVGAGVPMPDLGAVSEPKIHARESIGHFADVIVDGLTAGSALAEREIWQHWNRLRAPLQNLIEQIAWNEQAAVGLAYAVDDSILAERAAAWPDTVRLQRTAVVRIRLPHSRVPAHAAEFDRWIVEIYLGPVKVATFCMAVLGPVTGGQLLALGSRLRLAPIIGGSGMAAKTKRFIGRFVRQRVPMLEARTGRALYSGSVTSHKAKLDALIQQAHGNAGSLEQAMPASAAGQKTGTPDQQFWDEFFQTEDPWNYRSPYEQEKYQRQLALVPEGRVERALELACAEGLFTLDLATRVDHLIATDISVTAVDRTRARLAGCRNVDTAVLDFVTDPLPGGQDLILCSEVLYYLPDEATLGKVAAKIAGALNPGGVLITAHAKLLVDDRTVSGFDWGHPFGIKRIGEIFSKTAGLVADRTIDTELYSALRFRKACEASEAGAPVIDVAEIEHPPGPDVAKFLYRGGAATLPRDVAHERHWHVPVLMYHGIADSGPEALIRYRVSRDQFARQLAWLRQQGYYTTTSAQLDWYLRTGNPFEGRPIVLTFDDGMQSFADNAWPELRMRGFGAEVFVVTGKVGASADWDGDDGRQIPLMTPESIRCLAHEGVTFGSHLTDHVPVPCLDSVGLITSLVESRAQLEAWTGIAPGAVAAPFSRPDPRLMAAALECGFSTVFANRQGLARIGDHPLDVPRIEVRGDRDLADFISAINEA